MSWRIPHLLVLFLLVLVEASFGGSVEGTIYDLRTNRQIPHATVQVVGTGISAPANFQGHYRLLLEPGTYRLRVSHIGYDSEVLSVTVGDELVVSDAHLVPTVLVVPGMTVYDRKYDLAQKIILAAISRKQEILTRLADYSYDAYTRLVVRDLTGEDSSRIMLITETHSTSYWKQPNSYKEILTARRQSANLPAEGNLATIGEILNFNKNRLEIGKYAIVSPVADDALEFYNYYLLDSTYSDDRKIYRLEIEPKKEADPLVTGFIQIVDSTYDVADVDVGFNQGVRLPFMKDLHYRQRIAEFENEFWMPVQVEFSGLVEINFPGIPSMMSLDMIAAIHQYSFESGQQDVRFDEFVLEVAPDADDIDSTHWQAKQSIPLTNDEQRGYVRIDSVENAPDPLPKKIANVGLAMLMIPFLDYDLFHYNRVEGPYVGIAVSPRNLFSHLDLWVKGGYSFDAEFTRSVIGLKYNFHDRQRVSFGAQYSHEVAARPLVTRSWYNSTAVALLFKYDPFDYYIEEGWRLFGAMKLLDHTGLEVALNSYEHRAIGVNTEYSVFGNDKPFRPNPHIVDGDLRSLQIEFKYDSRNLWRNKGEDAIVPVVQYTLLEVGAVYSSPDFLSSDYDFRKYHISLFRRQRTLGFGITSISAFAGSSTRALPPQRYYEIGYNDIVFGQQGKFVTLGDAVFAGSRSLSIYVKHDFDRYLFTKSGIPLIKEIPLTISIHGGAFWTDFANHTTQPGDYLIRNSHRAYRELGFGVGNLTPFLAPFNLALFFTWQLSDYDTNDFWITWGVRF